MAENSAESGAPKPARGPGRPFAPGVSGNPGGRPAHAAFSKKCRSLVGQDGEKLAELAWAIARADVEKLKPLLGKADAEKVKRQKHSPLFLVKASVPRFQDRVAALLLLKEGAFGKTPDTVPADERYTGMSDVELLAELLKAAPAEVRAEAWKKVATAEGTVQQ